MVDPLIREENVIRELRIRFLREVLALKRKHWTYFQRAGQYDTTFQKIRELEHHLATAKAARKRIYRETIKGREKASITRRIISLIMKKMQFRTEPNLVLHMGKEVSAERISLRNRSSYNITVGFMWNRRIYEEFYERTNDHLGSYIILSAEKVRVNHKWIDLFEAKTFHPGTGEIRCGYVARTKTPQRHVVFDDNASKAARKAEDKMIKEMNISGAKND